MSQSTTPVQVLATELKPSPHAAQPTPQIVFLDQELFGSKDRRRKCIEMLSQLLSIGAREEFVENVSYVLDDLRRRNAKKSTIMQCIAAELRDALIADTSEACRL